MNRGRLLAIVAAVLLTLFGTFVIIAYIGAADRRAREGMELVTVLLADDEIGANVPAEDVADAVVTREIPRNLRQPDAIDNLETVEGQVTTSPIRRGEQIVERQFGEAGQGGSTAGSRVEEGMEIVSIALEPQRAVGGRLASGDRVSVLMSLDQAEVQDENDPSNTITVGETTGVVLSNIKVTAVTGGLTEEGGEAASAVMVSLEVDASDAERIAFGQEHGRIWLTLNGDEVPDPDAQTRSRDNIYPGSGGDS